MKARLVTTSSPAHARAAVVVLHGGATRREQMMVSPTQLSVLRMVPIAHHIARHGRGELAVFRLLNSARGWNTRTTPVQDARWAIGEVVDRMGSDVPIGLVGHSLGGRAAILASGDPQVRAVVALAPWVHLSDAAGLHGSAPVVVVHGTRDRIAVPDRAQAVVEALSHHRTAAYIGVRDARHAMLRRHGIFSSLAADTMRATLLGDDDLPGTIARALNGEVWQEV